MIRQILTTWNDMFTGWMEPGCSVFGFGTLMDGMFSKVKASHLLGLAAFPCLQV